MSDPIPGSTSQGASTGGDTGTQVGLQQLIELLGGLAGTLQTMTQQMASASSASAAWQKQVTDGLSGLETNVAAMKTEVAGATDSDSGYLVRTSVDPAANQRRLESYAEMAVADAIAFRKSCDALMIRKLSQDSDHHGALPPMAPRSASGPGTSAS